MRSGENTLDYWAGYALNPEDAQNSKPNSKNCRGMRRCFAKSEVLQPKAKKASRWFSTSPEMSRSGCRRRRRRENVRAEAPTVLRMRKRCYRAADSAYTGFRVAHIAPPPKPPAAAAPRATVTCVNTGALRATHIQIGSCGQCRALTLLVTSHSAPTARTKVQRLPDRGRYDRETVYRILDEAFICHVGFVVDGQPFVIPTDYARVDETLYVHGSSASRMLRTLCRRGADVRHRDAGGWIVMARSGFHSSMNYRSVVMLGRATQVEGRDEKLARSPRSASDAWPLE